MSIKSVFTRAGVFAVLLAGLTVAAPGAAHAAPGNCTTGWGSNGVAYGTCSTGSGQYRLGIPCKSWQTLGYGYTGYGAWRNAGTPASATCGVGGWLWSDIPGGAHIVVEKRN